MSRSVLRQEHKKPRPSRGHKDKRKFSATASNTHSANASAPSGRPMRGGIRL